MIIDSLSGFDANWNGMLAQYVGSLHRLHHGKTEVVVNDDVDLLVPTLARMAERRFRGYRALGYELGDIIQLDEKETPPDRRRVRILLVWWTRTRRIRTTAAMPIEVAILEIKPPPVYQRIAPKARHLQELGMSQSEIGRRLGVDRWTVGKALRWKRGTGCG